MELQLKNVGMIKEANVKIDGLTVIAGENDTGKSTVGKALWSVIKYHKILFNDNNTENILPYEAVFKHTYNKNNNDISLISGNNRIRYEEFSWEIKELEKTDTIMIETPIVWSFIDFFRDIAQLESQFNVKLAYPYLMKNLIFNMSIKSSNNNFVNIKEQVTNLMGGEFKKDDLGKFYFDKQGQRIEVVNTATGIKSFGILQMLSQNRWLSEDTILILDEPEVHLHPKWQLEMAKVIVELVKNGVKVLVNSHSPYMIEALKRYSELEEQEDKTNFYLAEDGYIKQINNSNSETLVEIFEKLSEPFDTFEKIDEDSLGKLING